MSLNNPFDVILNKLEQLQDSVNQYMPKQEAISEKKPSPYSEDFLTLPEVAVILKKPVGTVRGYIHSRGLPAKRLGKPYLIRKDDFNAWLEKWQVDELAAKASPADGYAQMLEHRKKYGRS